MKSYNQLTQQFLSANGLVRVYRRDATGQFRLSQIPKAKADRLLQRGQAVLSPPLR